MEKRHGNEHRPGLWNNHPQQNLERSGPVDHRRLIQLLGNAKEILPQQENVVRIGKKVGHNERQPRIHPAQLIKNELGGNQRYLSGQHNGANEHQKDDIFAGDGEASKAVSDQRTGNHRTNDAQGGNGKRVEK